MSDPTYSSCLFDPKTARSFRSWVLLAAVALLLAIPLVVSEVPFGVDTLNHLARIHIRANISSDQDLARLFEIRKELRPYAGMDLIVPVLAHFVPTLVAGKVYLFSLVFGLVLTIALLSRSFAVSRGPGIAIGALVAYNSLIAWGFLSYVLGMLGGLILFSAWHTFRNRPWWWRLFVFTGLSTVLYFTHLLGFVIYGLLVTSYEVFGRSCVWRTPTRDWITLVGQAIPAIALWYFYVAGAQTSGPAFLWIGDVKPAVFLSPFAFDWLSGKDLAIAILCALTLTFTVALRLVTIPRELVAPAIVMLLCGWVAPNYLFGIGLIDERFPVVAVVLIAAGIKLKSRLLSITPAITLMLLALAVVHVVEVSRSMRRCDVQYAEVRAAINLIERGGEVTTVLEEADQTPISRCTRMPIYNHLAQLITIDRSGYTPEIFSSTTGVFPRDGRAHGQVPIPADAFQTIPSTKFVLWLHFGIARPVPPGLTVVREGSFFTLWKRT